MDILSQPVLVLNSSYLPISIRSVKDAICLVLLKKAEVLKAAKDSFIRSEKLRIPVPNVIIIQGYYKFPIKNRKPNRQNILARDNYTCVYCGKAPGPSKLTMDHIIPKSRWDSVSKELRLRYEFQSWENVVTACKPCNTKKGSKLLSELMWKNPELSENKKQFHSILNISQSTSEKFGWNDFLFT
ncbi:MAG: HNH endonuclease [Leptospiraceae bacterium]|nr:HNH endonuclease [Leptospiraceae bacterium]MCP5503485.1 HNH endonuclease [Leptospiraceae bacterium]